MIEPSRPRGRKTTRERTPLLALVARMCRDESANALPEYAIILATLSIIAIVSFQLLGNTSTNVVTTNQNNFENVATMSYQH
jgi:Flp pilus assembly pilin Flp